MLTGASLGRQASSTPLHPQISETNIQLLVGARAYTKEPTELSDAHYALIKEYAQSYDTLTDAHADNLAKRTAALEAQPQYCAAMDSEIP
jgi:hypothetical protein